MYSVPLVMHRCSLFAVQQYNRNTGTSRDLEIAPRGTAAAGAGICYCTSICSFYHPLSDGGDDDDVLAADLGNRPYGLRQYGSVLKLKIGERLLPRLWQEG